MKDKTTKAAKILALTEKGGSVKDIAKAVKCDDAYVYYVRWMNKNKKKKPSKIVGAVKQAQADLKKPKVSRKELLNELQPGLNALFGLEYKKQEATAPDMVNHPPHYKSGGIETIDFIEAKDLNYRLGNVVKYVSRAGRKVDSDPVQDLEKALFYLKREIETRKGA